MDVGAASKIMDGYAAWWRNSVDLHQEGDAVRIVCPMLDRHNDHMSIYLADGPNGGYVLTDLGATVADLANSGCDIMSSKPRTEKLGRIVQGYGVSIEGEELFVRAGGDSVFQAVNMLMQSMASVDDLFFTTRDSVRNLFVDDVKDWLLSKRVRFVSNVKIAGRSGFEAKYDFVIPPSHGVAPERYLKAVSSPSEQSISNAIFGWNDIKAARGEDTVSYLFLNAANAKGGDVSQSLIGACESYGVKPVIWGRNESDVVEELAA